MNQELKPENYKGLIKDIGKILEDSRTKAFRAVNEILVKTYWEIGRRIVVFEQQGKERAEYGSYLLEKLSKDLRLRHGKGFSRSNITYMRLFYLKYQKSETLSHQLSWSHYFELLKIEEDLERSFYEKQCINENWSVRELKRQIDSALFYRLALSKNKEKVLELSKKGQLIEKAEDLIKDPYVFEFLDIQENHHYSEKEIEQKLIDNLQRFLLELGKGFTFVSRQFRISLGNEHFYIDLVFYHRILKCFVLIDLKIDDIKPADIGQMNMYLNYFKAEEKSNEDNEPIGIILSARKDKIKIDYALGGISNKLFVSKYKFYLPNKKELEQKLKSLLKFPKTFSL